MHRVVTFSLLAPLAPFSPFSVSSAFLFSGAAAPFSACPFSAMASKSALQLPVRVEELLPSLYIVVYIAQLSLVTLHRVVLHCCYEWNKWRGKIHVKMLRTEKSPHQKCLSASTRATPARDRCSGGLLAWRQVYYLKSLGSLKEKYALSNSCNNMYEAAGIDW